jgi:hypothetical protein
MRPVGKLQFPSKLEVTTLHEKEELSRLLTSVCMSIYWIREEGV